jgi:hypothetical protein
MSEDLGYGLGCAATRPQGRPAPATRRGGTDPAEVWLRGGDECSPCGGLRRGVWEHGLHCPSDIDLNEMGTYSAGTFLEAQASITSEAVVPTALKVNYRGGSEVHLRPGFHAIEGSSFHAFIHPCDMSGNSFRPKSLGVPEANSEEEVLSIVGALQVYPNPASESFTVNAAFIQEHRTGTMRLYGATGELVKTSNLNSPIYQVDATNLRGLFLVVVESGGRQETRKIILQ